MRLPHACCADSTSYALYEDGDAALLAGAGCCGCMPQKRCGNCPRLEDGGRIRAVADCGMSPAHLRSQRWREPATRGPPIRKTGFPSSRLCCALPPGHWSWVELWPADLDEFRVTRGRCWTGCRSRSTCTGSTLCCTDPKWPTKHPAGQAIKPVVDVPPSQKDPIPRKPEPIIERTKGTYRCSLLPRKRSWFPGREPRGRSAP